MKGKVEFDQQKSLFFFSRDEDPDPVRSVDFGPPDPDTLIFGPPDPTCDNEFIKLFSF